MNWNNAVPIGSGIGPGVGGSGSHVTAIANPVDPDGNRRPHLYDSSDGGATFGASQSVGDIGTSGVTPAQVAYLADGSAVAAIPAYGNQAYHQVHVARRTATGQWQAAVPATSYNSNGGAIAVHNSTFYLSLANIITGGASAQITTLMSTDGGVTWLPDAPTGTFPTNFYCNETAIAVNSAGERMVAYEYGLENQYQLYAAHTVNGVWQSPQLLGASPAHYFWPRIAANGQGYTLVAQRNATDGVHVVMWQWSVDGGWGNEQVIAAGFNPTVAHDGAGNIIIGYVEITSGAGVSSDELAKANSATDLPETTAMTVKACSSIDSFANKAMLSTAGKRAAGPQSVSHAGSVTIVYQEDDNGWQVVARTLPGTEPPPHSEQIFQDEPPTSDFYEVAQWAGQNGYVHGYPCGGPNEPCVPPLNLPYLRKGENLTVRRFLQILFNKR